MNPEITVIIATYNSSRTLKFTIQSLLDQDFENFEAWIVGDACSDDSEEVVASFNDPRLNWTNLPANSGSQSFPNNEGLSRSRGMYIAYLGHDDLWFPWHLSMLHRVILETGADLVHPLIILKEPEWIWTIGPIPDNKSYDDFHIPPSGWLHSRTIYENGLRCPHHRKSIRGVDQTFLGLISKAGYKIHYHPAVSVLKFPSRCWQIYDQESHFPQESYYRKMSKDPIELDKELTYEMWSTLAILRMRYSAVLKNNVGPASGFLKKVAGWYGLDRWPISMFRLYYSRRKRKRGRIQRGLDK